MTKCSKCHRKIGFGERINYNNQYMCPLCAYEESAPESAVRKQIELNYPDLLKEKSH